MVCISHAPIEKLRAYKQRMGWSIPFVSSFRNDFNFDFGVSFDKERGSAEYNFQKVDFDEVLKQFEGSDTRRRSGRLVQNRSGRIRHDGGW